MHTKFVTIRITDPKGVRLSRTTHYNHGEVVEVPKNASVDAWLRFKQAEIVNPVELAGGPSDSIRANVAPKE